MCDLKQKCELSAQFLEGILSTFLLQSKWLVLKINKQWFVLDN